ncbi:MAG: chemotaxis protein CheW [Acidobacteria bacterium]|nr:chemotaxis protein CheW [Acidobacteriota bacterium]
MANRSSEPVTSRPVNKASAGKAGVERTGEKFLTFFLAGEEYGIEILKVQEIIGMMGITRVPRTPHFVRGVINLRGKVIPVVDLRLKFGMESIEQTAENCIIVVQTVGVEMGIIVDKVSEVSDIAGKDIDEAPSFGADVQTDYILGIGKSQGRVKLLLDIDKVLSTQELVDVHSAAADLHAQSVEEAGPLAETTA